MQHTRWSSTADAVMSFLGRPSKTGDRKGVGSLVSIDVDVAAAARRADQHPSGTRIEADERTLHCKLVSTYLWAYV